MRAFPGKPRQLLNKPGIVVVRKVWFTAQEPTSPPQSPLSGPKDVQTPPHHSSGLGYDGKLDSHCAVVWLKNACIVAETTW